MTVKIGKPIWLQYKRDLCKRTNKIIDRVKKYTFDYKDYFSNNPVETVTLQFSEIIMITEGTNHRHDGLEGWERHGE